MTRAFLLLGAGRGDIAGHDRRVGWVVRKSERAHQTSDTCKCEYSMFHRYFLPFLFGYDLDLCEMIFCLGQPAEHSHSAGANQIGRDLFPVDAFWRGCLRFHFVGQEKNFPRREYSFLHGVLDRSRTPRVVVFNKKCCFRCEERISISKEPMCLKDCFNPCIC
jgi:hypothetical protein